MMKKVLSLLIVMCIIIGMLPAIALAVDNDPYTLTIEYSGDYGSWDKYERGQTAYYTQIGNSLTTVGAGADNYVLKLEYLAEGDPTIYINGLNLNQSSGYILFEGNSGDYKWNFAENINVVIEKDSSYTVDGGAYGGFDFYCSETVTISSAIDPETGEPAKLTLSGADTSTDSAYGYPMDYQGTLVARGDLVIDGAVLDITANENYGIFVGNSLTITDSEVKISAARAAFNKAPIFGKGLDVVAATVQAPEDADLVEYVKDDAASYKYVKIDADVTLPEEPAILEDFYLEYWNGMDNSYAGTSVKPGETAYFAQKVVYTEEIDTETITYSRLTTEGADADNYVIKVVYPANKEPTVYFNGLDLVNPKGYGVLFERDGSDGSGWTTCMNIKLVVEKDSSIKMANEGTYGAIEAYCTGTFTISSVDGAKLTLHGEDTAVNIGGGQATIWARGDLVIDGAALEVTADKGYAIGAAGTITIIDSEVIAWAANEPYEGKSQDYTAFNNAPDFGELSAIASIYHSPADTDIVEYAEADAATYRYVKITVNEEEPEVPVEPAYKFSNTVTCNETLDLNFYLPKDAVPMAATWTVTYGGKVLEEGEYSLDLQSDGRMRVRVSYYPHQLNNEVTVICKDANGVVLAERSNSIQGYCMAYLGLANGKALDRALMVAMLEYGSWAQIGVSSADPLANRDLTAAHKAYLTDYAWPASGAPTVFAENNQTLDYTFSCSVTCNETLDLNFYLHANATDQAASWTVTIDGEEVSEGKYMISKDAKNRWRIRVSFLGNQMNSLVSVTAKDAEGNVLAQRSNSIREYAMLYLAQSSATARDSALMVAMLEFGSLAQIGLGQTDVLANYLLDDTYRANLTHTHNYSSKVTAPTCTEKGYTTYTCSCGHTYTANQTAAKGHSYSEATCTKAATCACGAVNGTPLGHFYNYGICSRCDAADPNYNEPAPGEPGFVWKIATTTGDLVGYGDYDTDADAIRGLYDAGFRYIDFSMYSNLTSDSVYMSENWREEVLKLKAVADELGMTFVQAHSPGGNLLTTNQSEANELIAATKRSVEICEVLGIRNLVVHIGWRDGLTREQWMQQNKIMYNNFLPLAEKCGVNILCENSTVKNMGSFEYLSTGAEMREFVEYVDHPNFHACWDTGHANCDNLDQYQNIVDLGDELYAIHYAENDGSYDSHVMPFFGTVNHNDIMRALVEIGFRGPFVLECDGGSRTSNTYTGPAFDWIKEELNVTDPTNPSVLGRLNRAQQEKLLFDIANYIVTTYPTTAP